MEEKLTTAIKTRRFLECEKDWLYSYLQKEKRDKYNEISDKFTDLIQRLIKKYYDPDLLKLGEKRYCYSQSSVHISSESLGLPKYYCVKEDSVNVDISCRVEIEFGLPSLRNEKGGYLEKLDISEFLKEKCTEPELDLVRETLLSIAKARYEYNYFGFDTWIGGGWHGKFRGTDTWGKLYLKNPEYFRLVRDKYMTESDLETMNSERSLLQKMKAVLGY